MLTIDAQVHAYERDHPGRRWLAVLHGPKEVTGDQMVAAMDAVGVDGALLVSPFTMYGYDASYALEVRAAHPGRFGLIKPVDPNDAKVADTIAEWAASEGAVAIRLMLNRASEDAADPGLNRVLSAAARHALPVNLLIWGRHRAGPAARGQQSEYDAGGRSPRPAAAVRAAGAGTALGRAAEGAGARRPRQRRDQDQRRVHALARSRSPTRIFGTRSSASSTPSASSAACGAPTGRARWRS